MKRLTVLRHAKSSWDQPQRDDFDRPLNERGWKSARRIGRELKRRKMRFDFALASPAARVRETLDGLAEGYGEFDFAVKFEPRIYLASKDTLLELVRAFPDEVAAPLVVGHSPGLERLIVAVTDDDGKGRRAQVAEKFPTAAVAVIDLRAKRWAEVDEGGGTVVELILPRELD